MHVNSRQYDKKTISQGRLNNDKNFPRLQKILGDNAYKNVGCDLDIGVTIEATERAEGQKGSYHKPFDGL